MASDRKRKCLTLEQRVDVLKKLDSGRSVRDVAAEFGVGKTQIAMVRSTQRESVKSLWEEGERSDKKTVKRRKTTYETLNTAVWEWFCALN
jgi:hypothetical protein